MQTTVLGCGRWGTFISWYMNKILEYEVICWGPDDDIFKNLQKHRKNEYLTMPKEIEITSSLEKALTSDFIVISISCQKLREFAQRLNQYSLKGKTIILAMKGLEEKTGKRLTQIISEEITQDINLAIWVGPGHVQSFTKNIPNCMIISCEKTEKAKEIIKLLNSNLIRYYYSNDIVGNEIGAASKNVMGIAAGVLDGLGYTALKGALMARGAREISRLLKAMDCDELTAYGLCHLGDYEATLFSEFSNNRKFGETFVGGKKFNKLAEGVATSKALLNLSEKYKVDLPITMAVNELITSNNHSKKIIMDLFLRPLKEEFYV